MPIQAPQWTEFLTCPICYNEFDEHSRQPISLGCGHTLCDSCLSNLPRTQCPFDQAVVETDVKKFPFNYALLQLVGVEIPDDKLPAIQCVQDNPTHYREAKHCIEELALFLRPVAGSTGYVNGNSNGVGSNGSLNGNGNNVLTRPMQRKLVTLVNCQLAESEGRTRAMRAARSLGERTVTELILLHQNQQQLSTNLWSAVRNRGCQFLGPAMQEEALKLILLALEGGEALSRKVLVLFVVQKLEPVFSQASKTSIGHVVQLLYRASCFKVTKRDDESSLMQLKESFRTYDALRKEHDAQIVQIATEAGLRILPDQWSSLLYGDLDHKSHMQSIIDKLQSPTSFSQSIQELIIALQRSGDPGNLSSLRQHFELLSIIDASPDAKCPEWDALEEAMKAVHSVVHGLVNFQRVYGNKMRGSNDPPQPHNNKFKTSMCRDFQRGGCPRGVNCTFAHSEEELERYGRRRSRPRPLATRGLSSSVSGAGPDQYSPQAPIENGSDSNPTATQALASCVNGSARSSPQFTTAGPVDVSSTACYGHPPQYNRRGSQEQMLSQRMKQMSIQASQAAYQAEGGYCPPRSPYEHIPPYSTPSGGDSRFYATYYGQSASPGNSYSSVVPRGEGKNGSAVLPPSMTPPRNSPLTVQEDGMNGLTNGHIDHLSARLDHPHSLYKNIPRPRRDMAPMLQQSPPPGATNYQFDLQYSGAFTSDPTHLYSHTDFFNHPYSARPAASYEHIPHGALGYHLPTGGPRRDMSFPAPDYYNPRPYYYDQREVYPAEMNGRLLSRGESGAMKRSPYIPDIMDDFKTSDSSSPRSSDTGNDNTLTDKMSPAADCELLDHWLGYTMCRKDTTLSSASSGVSSGSPLSHSPAASQSSNSSLSPRQQSPVGWQHGSDTEYIWRSFPDDSNTLPPPSAITDTVPIWRRGNEVSRLWGPLINMDEWARNDEQIKKDEQLARCLQEIEQSGSTPPTDTNSCNLTLQGLDTEDQQSSDQVRRGQDGCDRLLEDEEAERKRRKREEHQRLLQERRKLLRKQEKEKQERDDRKLAEEIAFRDAQQAGLVPPDPRCIMKPFNPNVISRAPPLGLGFINSEEDISGGCDPFGELKTFRGSCASSLSSNDDVIDSSKMTSGCAGDIRVQE